MKLVVNAATREEILSTIRLLAKKGVSANLTVGVTDPSGEITKSEGKVLCRIDICQECAEQVQENFWAEVDDEITEPVVAILDSDAFVKKLSALSGKEDPLSVEFLKGKLSIKGANFSFEQRMLEKTSASLPAINHADAHLQASIGSKDLITLMGMSYCVDGSAKNFCKNLTLFVELADGLIRAAASDGTAIALAVKKAMVFTPDLIRAIAKQQGVGEDNPQIATQLKTAELFAENRWKAGRNGETYSFAIDGSRGKNLAAFIKGSEQVQILVTDKILTVKMQNGFYSCVLEEQKMMKETLTGILAQYDGTRKIEVDKAIYLETINALMVAAEGEKQVKVHHSLATGGLLCTATNVGSAVIQATKTGFDTDEAFGFILLDGRKCLAGARSVEGEKLTIELPTDPKAKAPIMKFVGEGENVLGLVLPIKEAKPAETAADA